MNVRILLIKGEKFMQPTEQAWINNSERWTKQGWRQASNSEIRARLNVEPVETNVPHAEEKEKENAQVQEEEVKTKRSKKAKASEG